MTDLKIVLAQSLDEQRGAARAEVAADRHQDRLARSSKRQHELPTLRTEYGSIYQRVIQALLKINFVRKQTPDNALEEFCACRMVEWMDSCERLRDKQSGILFPLASAVSSEMMSMVIPSGGGGGGGLGTPGMEIRASKGVNPAELGSRLSTLLLGLPRAEEGAQTSPMLITAKEGAIADGAPIVSFTPSGGLVGSVANAAAFTRLPPSPQHAPPAFLIKSKEPLRFDVPSLDDGSYQLSIAHLDSYALMSGNSVHVVVWCKNGTALKGAPKPTTAPGNNGGGGGGGTIYRKSIPPGCAWFRNFGIVGTGEIRVMVVADGWVRGAGVAIEITRLFDLAHENTVSHMKGKGGGLGDAREMKEAAALLGAENGNAGEGEDDSWLDGLPDLPGDDGGCKGLCKRLVYDGRSEYDPSIPSSHYLPTVVHHPPPPHPMFPPPQQPPHPSFGQLPNTNLLQHSAGIEVAPVGKSLESRLQIIDGFAANLFGTGLGVDAPFPAECPDRSAFVHLHGGSEAHPAVALLDAVIGLPDPTPLGEDE